MRKLVVSLDLSIELHKAGFPQTSEFSWYETVDYDDIPRLAWTDEDRCNICMLPKQSFEKKHAAPLADEILDQLPIPLTKGLGGHHYRLWINRPPDSKEIELIYSLSTNSSEYFLVQGESIADAAALMWLYLKKEVNI